jgi:hypothetical protein
MIYLYYEKNKVLNTDAPNWPSVSKIWQPWKYMLFGDPSLRIGGDIDLSSICCIIETGERYLNIGDAFNAVPENGTGTIVLLNNTFYNDEISVINKTIILDLNGKIFKIDGKRHGIFLSNGHVKLVNQTNGKFSVKGLQYGVCAIDNSTVEVTNSTGGIGGVSVDNSSEVTVNDNITAFSGASYILLGSMKKTQAQCTMPTSKKEYVTYTDGTSTIWVNPEASGNNYIVNKQPHHSNRDILHHEIHRLTCTNLPTTGNRIEVGICASPEEAIRVAREKKLVKDEIVDGCYICCNEVNAL